MKPNHAVVVAIASLLICSNGLDGPRARVVAQESGDGEVWITAQDSGEIKIVHGRSGQMETIPIGFGTSPHFVRFPASGRYAYVSALGDGTLYVIRAADRQIVASVPIAPATELKSNINPALPGGGGVHDATPSPDGTMVLAAHWGTNRLYKLSADEDAEAWSVDKSIDLGRRPICSVFHPQGHTAYVGLAPNGLAAIDAATLAVKSVQATDAAIPCTLQVPKHGGDAYLITTTGRLYHLDLTSDVLTDLGDQIVAPHIHALVLAQHEQTLIAGSRDDDTLRFLTLSGAPFETLSIDPTAGVLDRPDSMAIRGNNLYVAMRATGKLAIVHVNQRSAAFFDIAAPSDLVRGYAVHGVALRP